jgi:hypothetical protein
MKKKKISKFGKSLLLPSASLLVLFLGAGSAVTVATTPTLLGTSTATGTDTRAEPSLASASLDEFCQAHWGDLIEHGRYCRFEQWYHLNLKHAGTNALLMPLELLPGDTLRVEAARFPVALVGDRAYDASDEKVIVRNPGYLSFRAVPGQLYFSVERLGVERCFADRNGAVDTVVCPD